MLFDNKFRFRFEFPLMVPSGTWEGNHELRQDRLQTRKLELGVYLAETEPGEIVRMNSLRRGKDVLSQIQEHSILGEVSNSGEARLTSTLTVAEYLGLRR